MHPLATKSLDWLIIQLATRSMARAPGRHPAHLDEARLLLQEPVFFGNNVSAPRDLIFEGTHDFTFTSMVTTPFAENNRVYGKIFRADLDWKHRPALILLHGWNAECGYTTLFPRIARRQIAKEIS